MQADETCWSKVLFGPKEPTEERSLAFVEPAIMGENIIASCRRSEVEKLSSEWEGAIFCFLLGKRPHLPSLKDYLLRKWKLKGSLVLSSQPDGAFIMRFGSSEEKTRILETGPWFISGRLLVLKPWRRRICRSDLDLSSLPVWIRLPNLPLEFWSRDSLSRIGSIVGKPLFSDEATARKSLTGYTRLCAEVSADRPIPSEVLIDVEGSDLFKQKISVEWTPSACHHCVSFLHSGASCEAARKADALKTNAGKKPGFVAKIGSNGAQLQSGNVDGWTVVHRKNRKPGVIPVNQVEGSSGNGFEDVTVVNAAASVLQSPTFDVNQKSETEGSPSLNNSSAALSGIDSLVLLKSAAQLAKTGREDTLSIAQEQQAVLATSYVSGNLPIRNSLPRVVHQVCSADKSVSPITNLGQNLDSVEASCEQGSKGHSINTGVVSSMGKSAILEYFKCDKADCLNLAMSVEPIQTNPVSLMIPLIQPSVNSSTIVFPLAEKLDTQTISVLSNRKHGLANSKVDVSSSFGSLSTCNQVCSLLNERGLDLSVDTLPVTRDDRPMDKNSREITALSKEEDRESGPPGFNPRMDKSSEENSMETAIHVSEETSSSEEEVNGFSSSRARMVREKLGITVMGTGNADKAFSDFCRNRQKEVENFRKKSVVPDVMIKLKNHVGKKEFHTRRVVEGGKKNVRS